MCLFRGLTPPSVVYRAFGAFPRTAIMRKYFFLVCHSYSCHPYIHKNSRNMSLKRGEKHFYRPLNKHQRCERPQTGVLTPGTSASTQLSPERATENITCLISSCIYLCRPFGTSFVVARLPGVSPPSVVFRLFETLICPHELLFSPKADTQGLKRKMRKIVP